MTFEPLRDVRVLDLTSVVVGPASTWRLAQYGADVIKVESPSGDLMRGLGGASPTGQHAGAYLHLNRGKRNICLDLKHLDARPVIQRLIAWADVIVANMRPDALKRLGLDAETIRAKAPEKVYCLLTGYGTDGPYAGFPTYDSVVQGATGMAGLSLQRDGAPAYVPMLVCDHVVGEIAAGTIIAAVLQQKTSGIGASLEIPMFETMAGFVLQEHLAAQSFDPPVGPAGDQRLLSPYNKPVQTLDGFISFTINTDGPSWPEAAYLGFCQNIHGTIHSCAFCRYSTTSSAGNLNPRPSVTRSTLIGYLGRLGLSAVIRKVSPRVLNVRP